MLRFHFDFLSPYAYLAWTQIHALATRHGRGVEPVPVLFPALLDHWGHRGPAEIPPKRTYVFKDAARSAAVLGVPLVPPPSHPFHPVLPLRIASLALAEAERRRLIDALWRAAWGGGGGLDTPERCASVIAEAGLEAEAILTAAVDPANKQRLREQTQAAIRAGHWGVPTIDADGELFWGLDSLAHLERFLRGEDPLPEDVEARWAHIRPSAARS